MSPPIGKVVVAVLLLTGAVASLVPVASGGPPSEAEFVRAVPNPVAPEDRGESVTIAVPPGTDLGRFGIDDGEERVRLPNRTVGGRVTLTAEPPAVRNRTDNGTVVRVALPALANGGETLRLLVDGVAIDTLTYTDAPEGAAYRPSGAATDGGGFRPVGSTDLPVRTTEAERARVFLLPDAPGVPVEVVRSADDRLLLAGYTLTSERVADALVAAAERGVRVHVLVDGAPVGGLTRRGARTFDRLHRAGVAVRLVGGPRARYAFHHAKYAVADDRAVVLTENWKPSGTGGNGSRGWGVTVRGAETASALARTFRTDFEARGARPWSRVRESHDGFEPGGAANGSYPARFQPREVPVEQVSVLVAPDNAERAVVERIDAADDSVRVLQATAGGPDQPFVRALVRAARRGVRVRLLLNGAWYAREGNRAVVESLRERAHREGLDLKAKLAEPRGRYGTVHAKGLVVDGETVLLGSLNWNNHSARENREVLLALRSEGAARYFGRAFRADWRGGAWRVPVGVLTALAIAASGGLWLARQFEFERRARENEPGDGRVGW